MKKVFLAIATIFAMSAMTACSGSKDEGKTTDVAKEGVENNGGDIVDASNVDNAAVETVEEAEPEDEGWNPPFEIDYQYTFTDFYTYRVTVNAQILKNGKIKGSRVTEIRKGIYPDFTWENNGSEEFSGKWSTTQITMGDSYQKVYALDYSNSSVTKYLPDDCEYIWICDNAYIACENYDLKRATKISEVRKL